MSITGSGPKLRASTVMAALLLLALSTDSCTNRACFLLVVTLRYAVVAVLPCDVERNPNGGRGSECGEPLAEGTQLNAPVTDESWPLR